MYSKVETDARIFVREIKKHEVIISVRQNGEESDFRLCIGDSLKLTLSSEHKS